MKFGWPTKKLGQICDLSMGFTPARADSKYWGHGYKWLSIADMSQGKDLVVTKESITEEATNGRMNKLVEPGTLLMSFKLSVGKLGFARVPMFTNEAIVALPVKNKKELLPDYLYYALQVVDLEKDTDRAVMGNTLNKAKLVDVEIPLPPLPEQRRIAAILDKADAVRRKRQESIRLTEEFLRSVFLDMFGDPVTNPKGWKIQKLGAVGTLDRGVSKHRPRNAPELLGGEHPLIQTGDVANSDGYIRTFKSTYSDFGLKQSKKWPSGTLCITIAANIARTGILTFDSCFPDSVVGFTPNTHSTTEYVQFWMGFLQKILEENAPESAQKNINLAILRALDIPVPPQKLQQEFSRRVKIVQDMKSKQVDASTQTDSVFNSLVQRAFRGEL